MPLDLLRFPIYPSIAYKSNKTSMNELTMKNDSIHYDAYGCDLNVSIMQLDLCITPGE